LNYSHFSTVSNLKKFETPIIQWYREPAKIKYQGSTIKPIKTYVSEYKCFIGKMCFLREMKTCTLIARAELIQHNHWKKSFNNFDVD